MKDDPKVKQLNNIRVQLENLSDQCATNTGRRTHADDTAFTLHEAAIIVCQAMNNIAHREESEK